MPAPPAGEAPHLSPAPSASRGIDPAFLSSLAHELRNPLAPLVNALFLLRARIANDSDAAWALDIVDRQVTDLRLLLDDTSDIARLLRGRLPRPAERMGASEIAEAAAAAARPVLSARRQSISVAAPESRAIVQGDRARLVRALSALLVHAGRTAAQGDSISIAVEVADDRSITFAVEGPAQASPGTATAAPASFESGIGMALADAVARWHGGALEQTAIDGSRMRCALRIASGGAGDTAATP